MAVIPRAYEVVLDTRDMAQPRGVKLAGKSLDNYA